MEEHKQKLDKEYENILQQFSKELEKLQMRHQQELERKASIMLRKINFTCFEIAIKKKYKNCKNKNFIIQAIKIYFFYNTVSLI